MIKILRSIKDLYINNRVINNIDCSDSNTGRAPTLDLFKLFLSNSVSSSIELSRILLKFDYSTLNTSSINIDSESFQCNLKLFNVNGGQTLPADFTLRVLPLSKSFDEGLGRDVIKYKDVDVANFLTASVNPTLVTWVSGGAGSSGSIGENVDILNDFKVTQYFEIGNEDLDIDITNIVSASLSNQITNNGLLIGFENNHETDNLTYFVKRFASREAFDISKHPVLTVSYDDSIQDELSLAVLNKTGRTYLYNSEANSLNYSNIVSGSTILSGSNCLKFIIQTKETGSINLEFSGSQYSENGITKEGIYFADFIINEDNIINQILEASGSITILPKWKSVDDTITFKTLEPITISRSQNEEINLEDLNINLNNRSEYFSNENANIIITIFKKTPTLKLVKLPRINAGIIMKNLKYSIRDIQDNNVAIDFSDGTKLSNDSKKHFFKLDVSNLVPNRSYTIDLQYDDGITRKIFASISTPFKVLKRSK